MTLLTAALILLALVVLSPLLAGEEESLNPEIKEPEPVEDDQD